MKESECPDCGGEIETRITGEYIDEACRVCGLIIDSKLQTERLDPIESGGEIEEL